MDKETRECVELLNFKIYMLEEIIKGLHEKAGYKTLPCIDKFIINDEKLNFMGGAISLLCKK